MQPDIHTSDSTSSSSKRRDTLPFSMDLELVIHDSETISELQQHSEGEARDKFALEALRIGVMALRQARGQIDAGAVRREGERILETLQSRLEDHGKTLNDRLTHQLKEYFDPTSGRFQERVERLIQKDGELEQVLTRQIGQDDSSLAKTLTAHIGQESPLMRFLDPKRSEGLLGLLNELVENQLTTQRRHILDQFSLDYEDGALSRFIGELNKKQGELSGELHEKVDEAVRQFSLDDDNSALSNLVRNMKDAQRTISAEFSLDEEKSALSRLKNILQSTQESIHSHLSLDDENSALARIKKELMELLKEQQVSSRDFQEEVRTTLEAIQVRKNEASKSTRHGLIFEDAVNEWLKQEAQKAGDITTATGSTTGLIKNCKIGDAVIELGPESAAPGSKVVVEAKEKKTYQLADARAEIAKGRDNRAAQIGLFVFSKETTPEGMEPFSRYGQDVFVVWDAEDSSTDLYLRAGYTVAKALCIREQQSQSAHASDFTEIDKAILEIEKQTGALDDIETWSNTIVNNSEKILKKIRTSRKSLLNQTEILKERTTAIREDGVS